MLDHNEADTSKWSYYDEYLKSATIKKARLSNKNFDDLIVEKIKSGEIARAVDVRDRPPVISSAPKTLQKFSKSDYDFEDAYEHAVESGADNAPYKKLQKFRAWLAQPDVIESLCHYQGEPRQKIEFELDKLNKRIPAVIAKLKAKP